MTVSGVAPRRSLEAEMLRCRGVDLHQILQDAGENEYPSNEQQTNMKWFCDLSLVDLRSMAVCARGCVWGSGCITAPCKRRIRIGTSPGARTPARRGRPILPGAGGMKGTTTSAQPPPPPPPPPSPPLELFNIIQKCYAVFRSFPLYFTSLQ